MPTTPIQTPDALLLRQMFDAAVAAAQPREILPAHLPERPRGRTLVVGAGKASAAMAAALEAHWVGPLEGLVITRYGHAVPTQHIEIVEAAHPVPDAAGLAATRRMMARVSGLTADDLVICLISGGGSALLTLPAEGLALEDKQAINQALLHSGATIHEMNCVRKHLSRIKGGQLALACSPARVVTLAISDVPGDDLSVIASGPTVADPSTRDEALAILSRYRIAVPPAALDWLQDPRRETPAPGDPRLHHASARCIATPQAALEAAARIARGAGLTPLILGDALEGEARDMGWLHAGIVRQIIGHGQPVATPCVLLSGGEATVTVRERAGRGGRNTEFLLALGLALEGIGADRVSGVSALAADTDGIDGTEPSAGAWLGPDTLSQVRQTGLEPRTRLDMHDSWSLFHAAGTLVHTGPTLTNVNDFRAIIVRPPH